MLKPENWNLHLRIQLEIQTPSGSSEASGFTKFTSERPKSLIFPLPAFSTFGPFPVRSFKILLLFVLIILVTLVALQHRSNPPYAIEIRHVSPDGTVTYEPQRYEDWNHSANIAGLRGHTQDTIYHSVCFDGLQYCFSRSGHVYAMAGAENTEPSIFDREWKWAGDPHEFPHYDYSKTSRLVPP